MVLDNICFLLNQFLRCSCYDNVIFCWVMHEQSTIDALLSRIDLATCVIKKISLVCDQSVLEARLKSDISTGVRRADILERSIARMPLYANLDTLKIDTSDRSVDEVADAIANA